MPDDAVEMKPTLGLTGLTMNAMALIAPALKKSAPIAWRPSSRPSRVIAGNVVGLMSEISAVALLGRVAERMSGAASPDSILAEVAEFVASVVKCDSCVIYVLEGEDVVLRASRNPHTGAMNRLKLKAGWDIGGGLAQHGDPVVVVLNASADPRFRLFNNLSSERFESFLSVPLVSRGRLVGFINVQNREPYHYSDCEVGLVSTVGFLAGAATEMARLEQQNFELARRLNARTVVERAKGLLQSDLGISEREAYQKIQRQSQQMRKAMKDIAEAIVLSHAVKCAKPD